MGVKSTEFVVSFLKLLNLLCLHDSFFPVFKSNDVVLGLGLKAKICGLGLACVRHFLVFGLSGCSKDCFVV